VSGIAKEPNAPLILFCKPSHKGLVDFLGWARPVGSSRGGASSPSVAPPVLGNAMCYHVLFPEDERFSSPKRGATTGAEAVTLSRRLMADILSEAGACPDLLCLVASSPSSLFRFCLSRTRASRGNCRSFGLLLSPPLPNRPNLSSHHSHGFFLQSTPSLPPIFSILRSFAAPSLRERIFALWFSPPVSKCTLASGQGSWPPAWSY